MVEESDEQLCDNDYEEDDEEEEDEVLTTQKKPEPVTLKAEVVASKLMDNPTGMLIYFIFN